MNFRWRVLLEVPRSTRFWELDGSPQKFSATLLMMDELDAFAFDRTKIIATKTYETGLISGKNNCFSGQKNKMGSYETSPLAYTNYFPGPCSSSFWKCVKCSESTHFIMIFKSSAPFLRRFQHTHVYKVLRRDGCFGNGEPGESHFEQRTNETIFWEEILVDFSSSFFAGLQSGMHLEKQDLVQ